MGKKSRVTQPLRGCGYPFKRSFLYSGAQHRESSSDCFPNCLNSFQKEALIGLSLGDLNIDKGKATWNARLRFEQGARNVGYLVHLYELFIDQCNSPAKFRSRYDRRTGKTY
jgi:hypothetical protein